MSRHTKNERPGAEETRSTGEIDAEPARNSDDTGSASDIKGEGAPAVQYVTCAHCRATIRMEEAIRYEHRLLYYGEHYHCRDCDPQGVWDCMSHDTDMDAH